MFIATYPASFLSEENGKGFHVRFPDLPEALTGGADLDDTLVEAADCLAEAIAGRIVRGDGIPVPSKLKRGQYASAFRSTWREACPLSGHARGRNAKNGVGQALGVSETVVRRMLDPKHNTKPIGFRPHWQRSASGSLSDSRTRRSGRT